MNYIVHGTGVIIDDAVVVEVLLINQKEIAENPKKSRHNLNNNFMARIFRKLIIAVFGKPSKCPGCGGKNFHWDHGGPNGENYWKCNDCGYMIKD